MLFLKHTSVSVPNNRMTLEQLMALGAIGVDDLEALKQRGYHSVPVDQEETSSGLIHQALDRLFAEADADTGRVRYVVMPYYYNAFPYKYNLCAELRERYGLRRATFFSIRDLLCSNWLMGLKVGGCLLQQSPETGDLLLMVSCEKAYLPDLRYGGTYFVVGDAATAAIVGKTGPGDTILAVHNVTDIRTFEAKGEDTGQVIVQDYSYFINMSRMIRRCLQQAGVTLADVKLFIPTNTLTETWENLAKVMKIPPERFFTEALYEYGHCNNCDLILNYEWAVKKSRLRPGELYTFVSIGSGGAIGCAVCRKG
ncbi:MAG: hypothetical protein H0Z34_03340 [Brevibacillus sp.]|nr:hypothetical protein [Brevibacillus sp.]